MSDENAQAGSAEGSGATAPEAAAATVMREAPAATGSGALGWIAGAGFAVLVGLGAWFIASRPGTEPAPPAEAGAQGAAGGTEENAGAEPAAADAASEDGTAKEAAAAVEAAPEAGAEPEPAPESAASEPTTSEDAATEAASTEAAPAEAATAEPEPEETATAPDPGSETPPPVAPAFDTVRAEADGSVLVAGTAEPGQEVMVMADGAEAGRATADDQGNFVAFLSMGASAAPRALRLMTMSPDGTEMASAATVIIAPATPEPVEVAEAAEAPATTADETAAAEPSEGGTEAAAEAAAAEPEDVPQVLIADDEGVRVMAADPVDNVIVDTISYGETGDVLLAGRATAAGFVNLYLDNAPVSTVLVNDDASWSARLTGIAAGVYTLRADETDLEGKVVSRFETPFQREAPDLVVAAAEEPAAEASGAEPTTDAGTVEPAEAGTEAAAPEPVAEAAAEPAPAADAAEEAPPAPDVPLPPIKEVRVVTVQPGFTLWRIARENYGEGIEYVRVYKANKGQIRNPDLIYPGQIFTVPMSEE